MVNFRVWLPCTCSVSQSIPPLTSSLFGSLVNMIYFILLSNGQNYQPCHSECWSTALLSKLSPLQCYGLQRGPKYRTPGRLTNQKQAFIQVRMKSLKVKSKTKWNSDKNREHSSTDTKTRTEGKDSTTFSVRSFRLLNVRKNEAWSINISVALNKHSYYYIIIITVWRSLLWMNAQQIAYDPETPSYIQDYLESSWFPNCRWGLWDQGIISSIPILMFSI